jgi:Domain of unknown function (DUF4168)
MPHSSRTSQLLASAVGAAMLIGAGFADVHAQQQMPQQPAMPSALSPGQIETFADAAIDLLRVQEDFDAQVQAAEDAEEFAQLQQQAEQEARQAVENHGLSVGEYTAIVQAANQDPQLYAMIVETMQQRAP